MEQANLNIGTIGQRLESARLSKGVSVSEAGAATKILSKFIEAMESDDFGALSAPVYAKSFIRMYAGYLGLDARPLVDEYISQHAPKAKSQLTEEVRQNLAKVDHVPVDSSNAPVPTAEPRSGAKTVFSDVNETITNLSNSAIPFKIVLPAVAGVIAIGLIVLTVSQCAEDGEDAPAPGGAISMEERARIQDGVPDAYLAKPGVVETERN